MILPFAHNRLKRSRGGFTIVEFMVATLVFSIVLLAVSFSIMQISRMYQRSMNASRTQAAARNLLDTVSSSVQYGTGRVGGTPETAGVTKAFCYGSRQFLYVIGKKVSNDGGPTDTKNAVISRTDPGGCANTTISNGGITGGQELLGSGMRLAQLSADPVAGTDLTRVTVRVVYGADDLLCIASDLSTCAAMAPTLSATQLTSSDLRCRGGTGSEYCSVSELSTTVQRRIK